MPVRAEAHSMPPSDRLIPAAETLARVGPYLSGYGITRSARQTGLDRIGIPVWCCYTPNSKSLVIAQGKGVCDDDARVSSVMEALERAVAGNPECPRLKGIAAEMEGKGCHPLLFPELLAKGRTAPSTDVEVTWIMGYCLFSHRTVAAPLDALCLDRTRSTSYHMNSDGLASGNSENEAINHALLERIERDAYVLWQLGSIEQKSQSAIRPASIADPVVQALLGKIESAGLQLTLFDITSDIGIPAFHALLGDPKRVEQKQPRHLAITGGSGAHPWPARAIARAITEAVQSRLTYIGGARDDIYPELFDRPLSPDLAALFQTTPLRDYRTGGDDKLELRATILSRLKSADVTAAYAFPLSVQGKPFSVVKVVVPALENLPGGFERWIGPRALARVFRL